MKFNQSQLIKNNWVIESSVDENGCLIIIITSLASRSVSEVDTEYTSRDDEGLTYKFTNPVLECAIKEKFAY